MSSDKNSVSATINVLDRGPHLESTWDSIGIVLGPVLSSVFGIHALLAC